MRSRTDRIGTHCEGIFPASSKCQQIASGISHIWLWFDATSGQMPCVSPQQNRRLTAAHLKIERGLVGAIDKVASDK